ncbi:hypothetical protein HU751_007985 [Pseudomonas sp. BW13M1]|uniref:Uncharacterized protein n=1 Tax=Pseudomonas peradeniyensis TaxID=2745488 RepID=A0A923GCD2_9PSED|nr:hypothetical protein [Pseudomonas peradeniyensis]MBV4504787.1 hypothetical protein [Pseudomonas peradeniyensis]
MAERIDWESRGKTIEQLIREQQSFENQQLLVELSLDSGETSKPISVVVKGRGTCVLMYVDNSLEEQG